MRYQPRAINRDFKKVLFSRKTQPLPLLTQELVHTKTGDEIIIWNSIPYPQEGTDAWLLGNSTDPMPTEPTKKGQADDMRPLALRLCDCGFAPGEDCCCPTN